MPTLLAVDQAGDVFEFLEYVKVKEKTDQHGEAWIASLKASDGSIVQTAIVFASSIDENGKGFISTVDDKIYKVFPKP